MIESALGIIDRLISLTQIRESNRRKLLEDHIEPIFLDMTTVHNDYRQAFEAIVEEYRQQPHSPDLVREVVLKKKAELEHLRVKVHALARAFTEETVRGLPEEAQDFFKACLDYFIAASGHYRSYRGHFSDVLEFMTEDAFVTEQKGECAAFAMCYEYRTESGELVGDDLGYKLWTVLQTVKEGWSNITEAYAVARAKLLK